jgi:hypothetical protein
LGATLRTIFILGLLLNFAAEAARRRAPIFYKLWPGPLKLQNRIPLAGEQSVTPKTAFTPGITVLFEDKLPGANWGHPAAIHIFAANHREIETIETLLPPQNLKSAALVAPPLNVPTKIKMNLSDLGGQRRVTAPERFFAVLINGNPELRHWNDFSFLYQTLVRVYGYRSENIFVADSTNRKGDADLDGDGKGDIRYESTKEGVQEIFDRLRNLLTDKDHVFLAVNDHGYSGDNGASLVLQNGEIDAKTFRAMLDGWAPARMLSLFQQCFGGGFVRPFAGQRQVALSASSDLEFSWANEDLTFDEFTYHLVGAFAGQTPDGRRIDADTNADGRVSAQEAFAYATAHDTTEETPRLENLPNAGDSALMGLGF